MITTNRPHPAAGTTDADMEMDYLLDMGPRFRHLADIYGVDAPASDGDPAPGVHVTDAMPGESWC